MKLSLVVCCLVSVFAVEALILPPPEETCPRSCSHHPCSVMLCLNSVCERDPKCHCRGICVPQVVECPPACLVNPCDVMRCGAGTECVNEPNCPCKAQCLPIKKEDKQTCVGGPETGNCRAYIPSWYYDTSSRTCKEFIYGGCGGNGNRYETEKDCLKRCQNKCLLPPVAGACKAFMKRYYFNQKTQQCEIFIYGGCQGNANNFETLVDCQKSCPPACKICKTNPCDTAKCYGGKCRAKPCSCQHECYYY